MSHPDKRMRELLERSLPLLRGHVHGGEMVKRIEEALAQPSTTNAPVAWRWRWRGEGMPWSYGVAPQTDPAAECEPLFASSAIGASIPAPTVGEIGGLQAVWINPDISYIWGFDGPYAMRQAQTLAGAIQRHLESLGVKCASPDGGGA